MKRINEIKLTPDEKESILTSKCAEILRCNPGDIQSVRIIKKSVDARRKDIISVIYTADVFMRGEKSDDIIYKIKASKNKKFRPVIIGFGPAGMFAALAFIRAGIRPVIFERGGAVEKRIEKVNRFWTGGILDTESNVQFGEGGAGTFSDGKLTTNKNSVYNGFILDEFIKHGAPEEIRYNAKPHIGTDNLINIVRNIRNEILNNGGDIYFDTPVTGLNITDGVITGITAGDKEYPADDVILAIGHSAHPVYKLLYDKGIALKPKPFSVGVRIEHLQEQINKSQYGKFYNHPVLGAADYKLAYHNKINSKSAYTFCMCPGGTVIASSTGAGEIVTNGMSNYKRDGKNANSALLVGVGPDDFGENPLDGLIFRQSIEKSAFKAGGGGYKAPVQTVGSFLYGKHGRKGAIEPSYKPGVVYTGLDGVLPGFVTATLKEAIIDMGKKLKGFDNPDAVLTAAETRSSSPLTVLRNEQFMSVNTHGLYPCGEGCGYAGGIMSAAADGIKIAEFIIDKYN